MNNDATSTVSDMSRPDKQELWKAFLAGFMESNHKINGESFNYGILMTPEDVQRLKAYFDAWLDKPSCRNNLQTWVKDYTLNGLPHDKWALRDIFNLYNFHDPNGKKLVDSGAFRQLIEAYCASQDKDDNVEEEIL